MNAQEFSLDYSIFHVSIFRYMVKMIFVYWLERLAFHFFTQQIDLYIPRQRFVLLCFGNRDASIKLTQLFWRLWLRGPWKARERPGPLMSVQLGRLLRELELCYSMGPEIGTLPVLRFPQKHFWQLGVGEHQPWLLRFKRKGRLQVRRRGLLTSVHYWPAKVLAFLDLDVGLFNQVKVTEMFMLPFRMEVLWLHLAALYKVFNQRVIWLLFFWFLFQILLS